MNTASLELSKELFELSGRYGDFYYTQYEILPFEATTLVGKDGVIMTTYSLGYLLRKLPEGIILFNHRQGKWLLKNPTKAPIDLSNDFIEDTPEDAACKLLIELIKQKVIKI
jgi:hypothetical protein